MAGNEEVGLSDEEGPINSALKNALIEDMVKELQTDNDERRAMRKALLFLISLVQADVPETASPYINYLLTRFPPLSDHFQNDQHPFIPGESALRTKVVDSKIGLVRVWQG